MCNIFLLLVKVQPEICTSYGKIMFVCYKVIIIIFWTTSVISVRESSVHIYMTGFNEGFRWHKKCSELDVGEQKSESAPYEGQSLICKID